MAERDGFSVETIDLVIIGGGMTGLLLAIAVKQATPWLSVLVVDAAKQETLIQTVRATAISAAGVRMLDMLHCWHGIALNAEPIREMIITDSSLLDPVRPIFLTFSGDILPGEAFAWMVENCYLNASLYQRAIALGIRIVEGVRCEGFLLQQNGIEVHLDNGLSYQTKLMVGADGVHSKIRELASIKMVGWPYDQTAIVCTVSHERPHYGQAREHFLPAGPFAILPLKGQRSSLVWTENKRDAEELMACDAFIFTQELTQRFGHYLGKLEVIGDRLSFPLGLSIARQFIQPRLALIGDAAHAIHPISGQGLNLGFRDAAALAEMIVNTVRLGGDIGSLTMLEAYQSWRRFETVRMSVLTDSLNRLFSNDCAFIRMIRDAGLGLVEYMPALKQYFMEQASGIIQGSPRLLLGKPL